VSERAERIIDVVVGLDPLADLPRTGWLLRGVRPCESIADHSYGVALVTMLLVDALRAEGEAVDGEKALRMALVHDAPEARTGDVPMPVKTPELDAALSTMEATLVVSLLPPDLRALWHELEAGQSLEARVVKAADKVHMMVKAMLYEQRGRGALDDFWHHPKTFADRGLPVVREVFEVLCARTGRALPR
jgi:putative hydrolase of HD superfamily